MSTLDQFLGGGGVKSVQTGAVDAAITSIGTLGTEDCAYVDVTISAVNTAKCYVNFQGGCGIGLSDNFSGSSYGLAVDRARAAANIERLSVGTGFPSGVYSSNNPTNNSIKVTCRLINSTTLRIAARYGAYLASSVYQATAIVGRWQVVEFA